MSITPEDKKAQRNAYLRANRAARRDQILRGERARRKARKSAMIAACGGRCARCGVTPARLCPEAFEFHHIERHRKRFNFCGSYTRSWAAIAAELLHAQVLCSNCHRERECEVRSESGEMNNGRPTKDATEQKAGSALRSRARR